MTELETKTENLHQFKNPDGDIVVPKPDFVPPLAEDDFDESFESSPASYEPELTVTDTDFEVPSLEPDEEAPLPIVPAGPFEGDPYAHADSSDLDRLTKAYEDSQRKIASAAAGRIVTLPQASKPTPIEVRDKINELSR